MSDKIKPSEVSEILVKELQGINSEEKFDEVGTVLLIYYFVNCVRIAFSLFFTLASIL